MDTLLEQLADLEHRQWSKWCGYMLENMTPENIERWKRQMNTPYSQLSEQEKNSDREWAQRVLSLINFEAL